MRKDKGAITRRETPRTYAERMETFINTWFVMEGVPHRFRPRAKRVMRKIYSALEAGSLAALHIGFGRRIGENSFDVKCGAWMLGQYEGTWTLKRKPQIGPAREVWCIFATFSTRSRKTKTIYEMFPVRQQPKQRGAR